MGEHGTFRSSCCSTSITEGQNIFRLGVSVLLNSSPALLNKVVEVVYANSSVFKSGQCVLRESIEANNIFQVSKIAGLKQNIRGVLGTASSLHLGVPKNVWNVFGAESVVNWNNYKPIHNTGEIDYRPFWSVLGEDTHEPDFESLNLLYLWT